MRTIISLLTCLALGLGACEKNNDDSDPIENISVSYSKIKNEKKE